VGEVRGRQGAEGGVRSDSATRRSNDVATNSRIDLPPARNTLKICAKLTKIDYEDCAESHGH